MKTRRIATSRRSFLSALAACGGTFTLAARAQSAGGASVPADRRAEPVSSATRAARGLLRIGITPVILSEQAAFLARWADHLSRRLGRPVGFTVRNDYRQVIDLLFDRQITAAWICGYPYVLYRDRLILIATPLYRGEPTYEAYLIRRRGSDRPIHGWRDLAGRVLAYADPLSNSGWLVAQAELTRALGDRRSFAPRSFFAHGHRNVIEAVAAGLADAGSVDGYVWDTLQRQHWSPVERTEIVWRSPPYGFPPLVALRDAATDEVNPLRSTLLAMAGDEEGRGLLQTLNLDGFALPAEGQYEGIAQLARQLTPMR